MRARLAPAVALLAILLLAGYIYFWYWPRERPAAPEADGSLARAMAAGGFDACFWAPFPHQNLGVLGRALGDWRGYLDAAARVAGLPPPSIPAFGPFAVPPARDIAACSDAAGGRLVVSARIYPALAVIAKAAGRLAGNPWLAGGDVEGERRPTRVSWESSRWTVTVGGGSEEASSSAAPPPLSALPPGLAVVLLERAAGSFPAGSYLLRRPPGDSADLELALAGETGSEAAPFEPDLGASPPVLLATAGPEGGKPAAAFALFPAVSHGSFDLPGAAVFPP
ncbi:MAG TPA: hypothetical protein VOA87_19415, partial [Thermoanaerobaculia bacterium]|nr:hypothetical protein [Thermoanaerobaculia bacterium]